MNKTSMYIQDNWKMAWTDGQRGLWDTIETIEEILEEHWLDAKVPGEVHADLWEHGLISNPYEGLNALQARWVEESIWIYRTSFDAPKEALEQNAWLQFEGLDYTGVIYLNGQKIGAHQNFYTPCTLDVTGMLKPTDNDLVVELESGLFNVAEKPIRDYYTNSKDAVLHKRNWLRKPQCSFGWDWSTRFINVGIHKPVRLGWTPNVRLDQTSILARLNETFEQGFLTGRVFITNMQQVESTVSIRMEVLETGESFVLEQKLQPDTDLLEIKGEVPSPKLWWPAGHGEQSLYTLTIKVECGGILIGSKTEKVGFRDVRVNQDPNPQGGNYFCLEINGKPIFAKGANFVPADMIFARVGRDTYRTLLDRAREAHFNMLRVWGGGLYESDDFYELCDQYGIMVWQDFIYACGGYPANNLEFLENVTTEAIYQVRRMASRPSLVMYCGNNENEWHTYDQKFGVMFPDHGLYHHVLPRIVQEEDPGKYYQPSSPYSPDGAYPNRDDVGDQHPWSVGFEDNDFRAYRSMISRFPNEGGIMGPTSLSTVEACLVDGQRHVNSFAWQVHDNGGERFFKKFSIQHMFGEWLQVQPERLNLEQFVYWSGILHGEGLREYIDNFRSRQFDSASAIFWMFNDCWPATRSWSIVDYYFKRTPAFYFVKRSFAPLHVVLREEENEIEVFGINEHLDEWVGELEFGCFTLEGEYSLQESQQVVIPSNTSKPLGKLSKTEWERIGFERSMAFASLSKNSRIEARNRLIMPKFKEMQWKTTEVTMRRDGGEIVFNSSEFVWNVCLDLNGDEGFTDNFFDIWPEREHRISWPADQALPEIKCMGNVIKYE